MIGAVRALLSLLLVLVAPVAAWAQPAPKVLRLCLNEVPHPPWRFADAQGRVAREGLDFFIAQQWAQRSGLEVQIALQPWKRCLADLKDGLQDAVLSMSHLPERDAIAVFPRTASGQLDEGLALRFNQYAFYVRRDSGVRWDGHQLKPWPSDALVGVQAGYSVASLLRQQGFKVDEAARTVEANLEKLVRGRVQAAALQENEAERVLELKPALAADIERLQPLLERRPYFTVFSHAFAARAPVPLARLWRDVAAVRDSAAFRRAEHEALKRIESE